MNIKSAQITSNDELLKLVIESLPNILGDAYDIISEDMPFDGCHILALQDGKLPVVISCDNQDGGRALLSGMAVLGEMSQNNAIIRRLYPDIYTKRYTVEDTHLVVLSPEPPPGDAFLASMVSGLSVYTFKALQVDDSTGLYIEPYFTHLGNSEKHKIKAVDNKNRTPNEEDDDTSLSREETAFFQKI